MSNLCKPVYFVNALPKLRFFSSEKRDESFQKAMNHKRVPVDFLLFSPGTTTAWDCVRNSPWD